eukprot:1393587-Lingulodinium_polyedra.AAC.1
MLARASCRATGANGGRPWPTPGQFLACAAGSARNWARTRRHGKRATSAAVARLPTTPWPERPVV